MLQYHSLFVKSFGWYVVKNEIYINMEYLEHGDLSHHLVRKFSEHETIKIASQVVKGVGFMHRYNFIHRDLKPAVSWRLSLVPSATNTQKYKRICSSSTSRQRTTGGSRSATLASASEPPVEFQSTRL